MVYTKRVALIRMALMAAAGLAAVTPSFAETNPVEAWASAARVFETASPSRIARQIRTSMAVPFPGRRGTGAICAAPADCGQPQASAPSSVVLQLSGLYNRHLRTRYVFSANGWNVYATGGVDPAQPDKAFLVLQVEDKASIIFDMEYVLSHTDLMPRFAVNGLRLLLKGDVNFWKPSEHSVFSLFEYTLSNDKPVTGRCVLRLSIAEMKEALYSIGELVKFGDEQYRLFYGDAVNKGQARYQLGPGKTLMFVQRVKDEYEKPVLFDAAGLALGKPASVALSKNTQVTLELIDQDTLRITRSEVKP